MRKRGLIVMESWLLSFTVRFIPVVRHAISIPAGIAKMSHAKFITLTTLAVIPWSIVFVYLGFKLGSEWKVLINSWAICEIFCACCYCLCNWLFYI